MNRHLKCGPSIFGKDRPVVYIPRDALNGAGSIILARQDPGGFEPFALLLPHQVYVDDIPRMLKGSRAPWALPVGVSAPWIQIAGPNPGSLHPKASRGDS